MDISLYYQEKGEGEPIFLLHGNGEDGTYFVKQIQFFSNQYRVIAVDTRGHGKSPRGTAPFTMEQFAMDLKELMAALQIPKAIILGFSDGANIALKSEAAKRSMEVLGLMIHEPNIKPAELRSIHIPTLVIAGTRDMIKEEHTRLIANEIPDAKLVIMRGNHFIANKRADRFNQEVETFLQSIQ